MQKKEQGIVSPYDATRMVIMALVWLLVLAAPLLPAWALDVSMQTEEGEAVEPSRVPVTFQSLEVAIHNQVAATQSWYHFRNDHDIDVEVTCEFALGDEAFVEGFSYFNGDERIVGEVLEKAAAEAVYQELTQVQRRDPGMLEQVGNHFRFRVYPVQPGETKPVEVRHLEALPTTEGVLEYRLPHENLPSAPASFALVLDITDDLPVLDVETVGFEGLVSRVSARHVRVLLEGDDLAYDHDLAIRYRVQATDFGLRLAAHRGMTEEGTFMLLVTPPADAEVSEAIGRDIVFVIDISGSMSGEPLEQTKWALNHILEQLHPDDRFEVIAFDDKAYPMFGGLQSVTTHWVQAGQTQVSDLQSQGGTNILNGLRAALDTLEPEARADRPRAIIFLTDGQGTNPASTIIGEVRQRDELVRIYSFGVGNGVNRPFLERIARENRGIATLVSDPDQLETEMRRLYDRISMPLMVDLDVRVEGIAVHEVYPQRLPDLYKDGEVIILGRYDHGGRGRVVVSGQLKGRRTELELELTLPVDEQLHAPIEKLWARERIAALQDMLQDRGEAPEIEQEITRLGIVYNLVTPYTTFLAVPESLKTAEIKEMIRQGTRGYDRKLIDSVEGIKLSMQHIPPGDPVLTVAAPADALRIEAYFPFGLVKRLQWDAERQVWNVRFLVPRDVADGLYRIRVFILHADRRVEWRTVDYYIDGTAPEFEANVPATAPPGETVRIEVDPFETVAEVVLSLPGTDQAPVTLNLNPDSGLYEGEITLPERFPEGPVILRIMVRDKARNRFERDFEVWEEDDPIGC